MTKRFCDDYGMRILPREEFMAVEALECLEEPEGNAEEARKLKERASQLPGAFVLYDKFDDSDGLLLVGDDPAQLDEEFKRDAEATRGFLGRQD